MLKWAGMIPKVSDRVDLRVVDAALASALFHGIPAARLLAHARLASEDGAAEWDARMAVLLGPGSPILERVKRAIAQHARVAIDERPIRAPSDATVAVLVWAVACDPEGNASLAEIAPRAGERIDCDTTVLAACAAYDDRLASAVADKRAPAIEACMHLSTRAALGPMPWERLRAITAHLERAEIGVRLFGGPPGSIFPRRVDDEIPPSDRRMRAIDREPLEALVARDPRQLGPAVWRTEQAEGGPNVQLATFLADLGRLLRHEGTLVAALSIAEPSVEAAVADPHRGHSWAPGLATEWSPSTAAALATALEQGGMTSSRARASVTRGGEAAADAIGAEMLHVGDHAVASAVFAEILAKNARPRDVFRLVTYFAMAPDPEPAARALGACADSELPRVLKAWLEAMLLSDDGDASPRSSAERVSACIASLKPYPQLYGAVYDLLSR